MRPFGWWVVWCDIPSRSHKECHNPSAIPNLTPVQVTHISRVGGNLQIRKEDVRANVFKPTVALPTMTVEEFGEIELERARLRQVRWIGRFYYLYGVPNLLATNSSKAKYPGGKTLRHHDLLDVAASACGSHNRVKRYQTTLQNG